jgi:hypothetical protein
MNNKYHYFVGTGLISLLQKETNYVSHRIFQRTGSSE